MPLGQLAFLGSGETARAGGALFEKLAAELQQPLRIALVETPAGFELNSEQVARRVGDFMVSRLPGCIERLDVVPARRRGTAFSPDDASILGGLAQSNLVFMGPGSPTYAVRQLRGSLAWELILARHRLGAALVLASAAAVAVGTWCLPVYEVYKVGEDMHHLPGLDLLGGFGLDVSVIPHWNNTEGGENVDTSRCFVGTARFDEWRKGLPADSIIVGLDEHTWLTLDLAGESCRVGGAGSASVLRGREVRAHPAGSSFSIGELGTVKLPDAEADEISSSAWRLAAQGTWGARTEPPCNEVLELLELRQHARDRKDWGDADRLRQKIAQMGWTVQDTKGGQRLLRP